MPTHATILIQCTVWIISANDRFVFWTIVLTVPLRTHTTTYSSTYVDYTFNKVKAFEYENCDDALCVHTSNVFRNKNTGQTLMWQFRLIHVLHCMLFSGSLGSYMISRACDTIQTNRTHTHKISTKPSICFIGNTCIVIGRLRKDKKKTKQQQ